MNKKDKNNTPKPPQFPLSQPRRSQMHPCSREPRNAVTQGKARPESRNSR